MFKAGVILLVLISLGITGCVAEQDLILPSKYQRIAEGNAYKNCIANATNSRLDKSTKAELIVRNSMAVCAHFKNTMLRAYPQRWRENYIKDMDDELYKREIAWIAESRKK